MAAPITQYDPEHNGTLNAALVTHRTTSCMSQVQGTDTICARARRSGSETPRSASESVLQCLLR